MTSPERVAKTMIWTHQTALSKLTIVWIVMGLSLDFQNNVMISTVREAVNNELEASYSIFEIKHILDHNGFR